jgi:hypothetical protein
MKNGRVLVRPAMISLDTEHLESIAIGLNEHIGTDPANLLLALVRVMAG